MAPATAASSIFGTFSTIQIILAIVIPLISVLIIGAFIIVYRRLKQRTISNEQPTLPLPVTSPGPVSKSTNISHSIPISSTQHVFIPADIVQRVVEASEVDITDPNQNQDSVLDDIYDAYVDIDLNDDTPTTDHRSVYSQPDGVVHSPPLPFPQHVFIPANILSNVDDVVEVDIAVQNAEPEIESVYAAYIGCDDNITTDHSFHHVHIVDSPPPPLTEDMFIPAGIAVTDIVDAAEMTATINNIEFELENVYASHMDRDDDIAIEHSAHPVEITHSLTYQSPSMTSVSANIVVPGVVDVIETDIAVEHREPELKPVNDSVDYNLLYGRPISSNSVDSIDALPSPALEDSPRDRVSPDLVDIAEMDVAFKKLEYLLETSNVASIDRKDEDSSDGHLIRSDTVTLPLQSPKDVSISSEDVLPDAVDVPETEIAVQDEEPEPVSVYDNSNDNSVVHSSISSEGANIASPMSSSSEALIGPARDDVPHVLDMLKNLITNENLRSQLSAIFDTGSENDTSLAPISSEPIASSLSTSLPADYDCFVPEFKFVVTDFELGTNVDPIYDLWGTVMFEVDNEVPKDSNLLYPPKKSSSGRSNDSVGDDTANPDADDFSYEYIIDFGYGQEDVNTVPFQSAWLPFTIPEEEEGEDLEDYYHALAPPQLDDDDVEITALITALPASPKSSVPDSPSSIYSEDSFLGDDESLYAALDFGKQDAHDVSDEIVQDSGVSFNDSIGTGRNDEAAVCLEFFPVIDTSQGVSLVSEDELPSVPSLSTAPTLPLNIKKKKPDISSTSLSAASASRATKPFDVVECLSSISIECLLDELMVPTESLTTAKPSNSSPLVGALEERLQLAPANIVKCSTSAPSALGGVGKDGTVGGVVIKRSSSLGAEFRGTRPLNIVKRSGSGLAVRTMDTDVVGGTKPLNIVKHSGSSKSSLTSVGEGGVVEDTKPLNIAKRSRSSESSSTSIGGSRSVEIVQRLSLNNVESAVEEVIVAKNPQQVLKGLMIQDESGSGLFAEFGLSTISVNKSKEVPTALGPAFILGSPCTFSSRRFKPDPFDTPPPQPLPATWNNSCIDEQSDSVPSHNSPKSIYNANANAAAAISRLPTSSSSRASAFPLEPFRAGKSEGLPSISLDSFPGLLGYHGLVPTSTSFGSGAGQALGSPDPSPLRLPAGVDAYCSLLQLELDLPPSVGTPESEFGSGSPPSSFTIRPAKLANSPSRTMSSSGSVVSPRGMDIQRPNAPTPSRGRFIDSPSSPSLAEFESMVWLGVSQGPQPFSVRARSHTAGSASPRYSPYRPSAPTPDRARHGHRRFKSCDSFVTSSSSELRGSRSFGFVGFQDVYVTPSGSRTSIRSSYSPPARPSAPTPSKIRMSCSSSFNSLRSTRSPPARPYPPTPSRMRFRGCYPSLSPMSNTCRRRKSPAIASASSRLPPSQTMREFRHSTYFIRSRPSPGYLRMRSRDVLSSSIFSCDSEPVITGPRTVLVTPVPRALSYTDPSRSIPSSDKKSPILPQSDTSSISTNSPIHRLADQISSGWYHSPHIHSCSSWPMFRLDPVDMIVSQTSVLTNDSYSSPSFVTGHPHSTPATPISALMTEIKSSLSDPVARVPQTLYFPITSRSFLCSPSQYAFNSAPETSISCLIWELQCGASLDPSTLPCRHRAPTHDISEGSPRYLKALCGTPSPTTSPTVPFSPPHSRPTSFNLRPESVNSVDDELMFRYDAERRPEKAYFINVYRMAFLMQRVANGERVTPNYTAQQSLAILEGRGNESKRLRSEQRRTRLIHLEDGRRAVRFHTRKLWENGIMEGITDGYEEEQGEMAGPDEVEPDWDELHDHRDKLRRKGKGRAVDIDDTSSVSSSEGQQHDRPSVESIEEPPKDDTDGNGFSMTRTIGGIVKAQPPHPNTWMPPRDPDEFIQEEMRRFWRRDMDVKGKSDSVTHAFGKIPTMSLSF